MSEMGFGLRQGCARDAGNLRSLAKADNDLVVAIDFAGAPGRQNQLHQVIDQIVDTTRTDMARGLSLSQAMTSQIQRANVGFYSLVNDVNFRGSVHAAGDSLIFVVPAGDIGTAGFWDAFWKKIVVGAVSFAVGLAVAVLCLAAFEAASVVAGPFCGAVSGGLAGGIAELVSWKLDHPGEELDEEAWGTIVGTAVAGAIAGAAVVGAVPYFTGLSASLIGTSQAILRKLATIFTSWRQPLNAMADMLNGDMAQLIADVVRRIASSQGPPPDPGGSPHLGTSQRPWRVMVVGDSMSQGREGDFTWRYRLWEWFGSQGVSVDFVGPYTGTVPADLASAPPPPPLQAAVPPPPEGAGQLATPRTSGGYAIDARTFDSAHFSVWGRQAAQDKDLIRGQVAAYQPDLLLVGLGFNDMGWFVSGPDGTLASMRTLVDQARAAKPDLRFALANVPQRTFISGRDDLVANTNTYNQMLAAAVPSWSTARSPVALVDWRGSYSCEPGGCPAGYDGLHPNALGEYQIAKAYARTLHDTYAIGASLLSIPASLPVRNTAVPANVTARSSPQGVTVTWDAVYGAVGYRVRNRVKGTTQWSEVGVSANRYDTTWTADGVEWEYQIRTDNGDQKSAWSGTVSTVAHPRTAAPPRDIVARATGTGMDVSWSPPTGAYTDTIDRYQLIYLDKDTPGAYTGGTGVRGTSVHIDGLIPGHHYSVGVITWNSAGGGMPGAARPITVGAGTPPTPTGLRVASTDPTTVKLTWNGSSQAAGYRVWIRNVTTGGAFTADQGIYEGGSAGIGFLFPGTWNYEFCVTAINGAAESGRSNCVVAPRPAGS